MCVKLTAAGVIPCRGELGVSGINCSGCDGVIPCRGELDVCGIESSWCDLLSRRDRCV